MNVSAQIYIINIPVRSLEVKLAHQMSVFYKMFLSAIQFHNSAVSYGVILFHYGFFFLSQTSLCRSQFSWIVSPTLLQKKSIHVLYAPTNDKYIWIMLPLFNLLSSLSQFLSLNCRSDTLFELFWLMNI